MSCSQTGGESVSQFSASNRGLSRRSRSSTMRFCGACNRSLVNKQPLYEDLGAYWCSLLDEVQLLRENRIYGLKAVWDVTSVTRGCKRRSVTSVTLVRAFQLTILGLRRRRFRLRRSSGRRRLLWRSRRRHWALPRRRPTSRDALWWHMRKWRLSLSLLRRRSEPSLRWRWPIRTRLLLLMLRRRRRAVEVRRGRATERLLARREVPRGHLWALLRHVPTLRGWRIRARGWRCASFRRPSRESGRCVALPDRGRRRGE